MKTLMMKLKVLAAVVAGMMVFGVNAAVRVTSGVCKPTDFVPLADNIIAGKLPTSQPSRGSEGAVTPAPLTDGIIGKGANYSFCYNAGTFVYALGDSEFGYDLKAVRFFGGWGGWRGDIHLNCIEYESVKNPGVWVQLTGSRYQGDGECCYIMVDDDGGDVLVPYVKKVRISLSVCNNGYHGFNEIEIGATESPRPSYLEIADYVVSNKVTGSTVFANDLTVGVGGTMTVDGADEFAFDTTFDSSRLDQLTWSDAIPSDQTFVAAADADLTGRLWYRKSGDDSFVPRVAKSQAIRYTTAAPVLSTRSAIEITMFEGDSATLAFGSFDMGSVGGTSAGEGLAPMDIPIVARELSVASGPTADADGVLDAYVTLTAEGDYVIGYKVMNEAGNVSETTVNVKIIEVELGEIGWTGAANSDWNNPANWSPSVVPRPDDEFRVPAGTTLVMPAGVYPATGTFKSVVVEAGATVICQGDVTTNPGSGVTINAQAMTVAGAVSADAQGYAATKGPGRTDRGSSYGGAINVKSFALPPMNHSVVNNDNYPTCHFMYGDYLAPTALGSGGAAGAGGGAVKLVVEGTLALTGAVTANGTGGGTGGSVWIQAGSISGAGTVTANGSASGSYGSSGGRVAIYHGSATDRINVSVKGEHSKSYWGLNGTLYEPGRYPFGTTENPVDVAIDEEFEYIFPADEATHYWNLTVGEGKRVVLSGGRLSLGDLTVAGDGTALVFGKWYTFAGPAMQALDFDSITLSGKAVLSLPDSSIVKRYELDSLTVPSGATLFVGRGDWSVYGGRGTEIVCSGDATIAGTLSAQGRGFTEKQGVCWDVVYGPGHGGFAQGRNDDTYGQPTRPTSLGTGGCNSNEMYFGGGAIKLMVAGTLNVTGLITADPGYLSSGAQCCASAGSVWIQAASLTGAGTISAQTTSGRRYGAAGRIAVETVNNTFTGVIRANVLGGYGDNIVGPGTIFTNVVPTVAAFGWAEGEVGLQSSYTKGGVTKSVFSPSGATQNSLMFARKVNVWKDGNYQWTEKCYLRQSSAGVANTVTYVLDDLPVGRKAQITVNGEAVKDANGHDIRVAADGTLTFSAELAAGADTAVTVSFLKGLAIIVR